jgi:hypothetical protein
MMEEIKKELLEKIKEQGLEIGEEAAMAIVKIAFPLLIKLVLQTSNKFDDVLAVLLPVIEPKILEALDKIDGKQDQA